MRSRRPKPDRETVWRALAEQRAGTLTLDRRQRVKSISFTIDEWTAILDTYTQSDGETSHTYTRVRALFHGRDDFKLRIARRNLFSGLADWLGRKRIHAGHPEIEAGWIVKSNSEGRAQSLLMLPAVVAGLRAMRSASVRIQRERGRRAARGMHAITIAMSGVVRESARLEGALDLCRATLDQLVRMGCAARNQVTAEPQ